MTETQRRQVVKQWRNSDETMAAFCRKKNLKYGTFLLWKQKAENHQTETEKNVGFVKLDVPGAVKSSTPPSLEIHIGRMRITIPKDFDEGHLSRILSVLQRNKVFG